MNPVNAEPQHFMQMPIHGERPVKYPRVAEGVFQAIVAPDPPSELAPGNVVSPAKVAGYFKRLRGREVNPFSLLHAASFLKPSLGLS